MSAQVISFEELLAMLQEMEAPFTEEQSYNLAEIERASRATAVIDAKTTEQLDDELVEVLNGFVPVLRTLAETDVVEKTMHWVALADRCLRIVLSAKDTIEEDYAVSEYGRLVGDIVKASVALGYTMGLEAAVS